MSVYIVDIEAVDTRYTKQWKEHLPKQLKQHLKTDVVVISGGETPQATTPGAFLNFGGTNVYKSKQLETIGEMFCKGEIHDGDYFLYTDAWNPTVIQLRYMAELLGVNIRIGGLWHAGSYDPHDFLGRLIGNKPWVRHAEFSMFETFDHNYFATDFHIRMFAKNFCKYENLSTDEWIDKHVKSEKVVRVGWPMEYLDDTLTPYKHMDKRDLILFPHRVAPEKQVEIFRDLKGQLPQYEFVICQEQELTKNEYHNLLGEAKMVFSANLQETLGISAYEGALVGAIPFVPNRLSYVEMYDKDFKYPSNWTKDWNHYTEHKSKLIESICDHMENYKKYLPQLEKLKESLNNDFFGGDALYATIWKDIR